LTSIYGLSNFDSAKQLDTQASTYCSHLTVPFLMGIYLLSACHSPLANKDSSPAFERLSIRVARPTSIEETPSLIELLSRLLLTLYPCPAPRTRKASELRSASRYCIRQFGVRSRWKRNLDILLIPRASYHHVTVNLALVVILCFSF